MSTPVTQANTPKGQTPPPEKVDLSGNRIVKFNNGWTREQEELMAGWADIASCYRWMHDKYEKKATGSNMWITVPVIVLSTLTGSASFIMTSVVGDNPTAQKYAQIGIGGVSIFTGILTTLGNFFRYAQSSEANRVASIAWGKFQRQIAVELALHPNERLDSMDFLKICRSELDRLIEQSPQIPDQIIDAFEREFYDTPRLKKPDIAHGIDHTKVFKDTNSNIKKLIVDAAVMLKQKRRVWHESMMPDVNRHLDKRIDKELSDLKRNFNASLEEKLKVLEQKMSSRSTFKTSAKGISGIRLKNTQINTTLPGSTEISPADLIDALTQSPGGDTPTVITIESEGEDDKNEYSKKS